MTILTDEQKQLIRDLAAREGIKLEAWISRCIVDGMTRERVRKAGEMMVEADADKYARLHKDQRVSESR